MSPLQTEDTEVHTTQLTDTLVGKASEQNNDLCDSDNSEFFMNYSDDTMDNSVKTLCVKKSCL